MTNHLCGPFLVDAVLERLAARPEHPVAALLSGLITERYQTICDALVQYDNTEFHANGLTLLFSARECITSADGVVRTSLDHAFVEHYSLRDKALTAFDEG